MQNKAPKKKLYPNMYRWYATICQFTPKVVNSWKNNSD